MKTAKILISVIGVSVIFFGSFWLYKSFSQENTDQNFLQTIESKIKNNFTAHKNSSENDAEKYNQALYYRDAQSCDAIKNEAKKSECNDYVRIAKILENTENSDCSEISDENRAIECKNLMYEKTAKETKNKNLCKIISDETISERCRENIDGIIFGEIIANNSASPATCATLEKSFLTQCQSLIKNYTYEQQYLEAIKSQNIANCGYLPEKNLAQKCQDEIIEILAEKENLPRLCERISDAEKKMQCFTRTVIQRDNATFNLATEQENLDMCQTISSENIKNRCNDIIVLSKVQKTKNTELCKNLKNQENVAICQKISLP